MRIREVVSRHPKDSLALARPSPSPLPKREHFDFAKYVIALKKEHA